VNSDENLDGRIDYHVMDEAGIQEDDEEMLDEDDIRARNANILQELQDKILLEEGARHGEDYE
jgi:hypothetical protein